MLVVFGLAAMLYGCYTFWLLRSRPERFGKLEPMKAFWGGRLGLAIHVTGYSVMPVAFGLGLVLLGLQDRGQETAPSPSEGLNVTAAQKGALRFGMARGELMAAGFTLVGRVQPDRIDVEDGDFKATIVQSGQHWRVERSGYVPIDQASLDECVAKILEARPKR